MRSLLSLRSLLLRRSLAVRVRALLLLRSLAVRVRALLLRRSLAVRVRALLLRRSLPLRVRSLLLLLSLLLLSLRPLLLLLLLSLRPLPLRLLPLRLPLRAVLLLRTAPRWWRAARLVAEVPEELEPLVLETLVDGHFLLRSAAPALLRRRRARPAAGLGRSAAEAERIAPPSLVVVGIADELQHRRRVRDALDHAEVAAQPRVGGEEVLLVEVPHLLRQREASPGGDMACEEAMQVVDVADQELAGIRVVRAVDRLRKIDDDRPIRRDEHVELGEITVHHAGAQHLDGRADEAVVHRARALGIEREIAEARGGVAVGVGDELHEQDALDEVIRHRHAHARSVQAMDHVHLGRAPGGLVLLATVLGPVGDGSLVTRVPDLAALGVLGAVLEGAVLRVLVDLRHRVPAAGDDEVHVGLLAAHERSHDLVEDAVIEERNEAFGHTHDDRGPYSTSRRAEHRGDAARPGRDLRAGVFAPCMGTSQKD